MVGTLVRKARTMSEADAGGSVLAWVIPPDVDPESIDRGTAPDTEIRLLAKELETACGPKHVSVKVVPVGVSRIQLQFADREAAFRAFDAASGRVRAHPDVVCRVVATTRMPER